MRVMENMIKNEFFFKKEKLVSRVGIICLEDWRKMCPRNLNRLVRECLEACVGL